LYLSPERSDPVAVATRWGRGGGDWQPVSLVERRSPEAKKTTARQTDKPLVVRDRG
jgi:hypothetical protein